MQPNSRARFRFYEELNDFLPAQRRRVPFEYAFNGSPAIKDAIEAIGVPHTEVDLIIVDGASVAFDYHLKDNDCVAVYPMFEMLDISPIIHLRPAPLRQPRFVLDTHLGKLARRLRLLGFDSLYENDYKEEDLVRISVADRRAILTRDRELLKAKVVTHGYWVRSTQPDRQAREVIQRFDLWTHIHPFERCTVCNGSIVVTSKDDVRDELPERTAAAIDDYYRCEQCDHVYWKGTHYQRLRRFVEQLLREKNAPHRH